MQIAELASEGASARQLTGEDGESLSVAAYNAIFYMIMSRQLQAGDTIHERKLALALGISRTPVREALHRLEAEGWLTRRNDRTLIVRAVSLREYLSALQIRELLEPHAAAMAAGNIDRETMRKWRADLEKLRASAVLDPGKLFEFDQALHIGIARATGNVALPSVLEGLRKITQIFENEVMPANPGPGFTEHIAIVEAIAAGNRKAASDAMRKHLDVIRKNILALVADLPGSRSLSDD